MIFHYSIIITSKGMKKRALCPLSGVHLTIKPTFAHVTSVYFATSKVTKEAEILQEGFSLIFRRVKLLPDSNKLVKSEPHGIMRLVFV